MNPIEGEVLVVDRVQRSSHHSRLHLGGRCQDEQVLVYIVLMMQRNTKKQENHLVLLFREKLQLHIGVTARKQLKCFHSWRKCKFAFFSDDDVLTKMAKVEKVCEETFYELSFIKLQPSLLNVTL